MCTKAKIAALLTTAAVAVAGCGSSSSSGVTPAAYVRSVCAAATNWRNSIQTAGGKLSSGVNTKSLTKAKTEYVTFVNSLVAATGQAGNALRAAGFPSVSRGKQIANSLVGIFNSARHTLANAASEAAALPTSSVHEFEIAASHVVSSIRSSLAGMSSVTPENNAELRAAAAKDKTCQALAATG
jgi:midasin (ATPase involved in ribosome maturation)